MGGDLKKVFWVITAVVVIGVLTTCVVNPVVSQIKNGKTKIETLDFTKDIDTGTESETKPE